MDNQAIDKMRGEKGSPITLTIIRPGKEEPMIVKLIRDEIKVKSVTYKMLEPGYGYVRLSAFQTHTGGDLANAIKQLTTEAGGKLKGLVLDLRRKIRPKKIFILFSGVARGASSSSVVLVGSSPVEDWSVEISGPRILINNL